MNTPEEKLPEPKINVLRVVKLRKERQKNMFSQIHWIGFRKHPNLEWKIPKSLRAPEKKKLLKNK